MFYLLAEVKFKNGSTAWVRSTSTDIHGLFRDLEWEAHPRDQVASIFSMVSTEPLVREEGDAKMIRVKVHYRNGTEETVDLPLDKPLQDLRQYFDAETVEILSVIETPTKG